MWADLCECEQEKAAILEMDAGMSRERAEEFAPCAIERRCDGCPNRQEVR